MKLAGRYCPAGFPSRKYASVFMLILTGDNR